MSMISSVGYPKMPMRLNPFMKAGCCGTEPSMQATQGTPPKGFRAEMAPMSQPMAQPTGMMGQSSPIQFAAGTTFATAPTSAAATQTIAPAMQPLAGNFWAAANDAIRPLGLGRKLNIMG